MKGSYCADSAFVSRGYQNWKKATSAFRNHGSSSCRKESLENVIILPARTQDAAEILSSRTSEEKEKSRKCLKKIFSAVQFLARQGLPLCGDGWYELNGNLNQLINLLSKEDANLATWTKKKTDKYTSKDVQNEVLRVVGQRVLRDIVSDIRSSVFTILVAEPTDISTTEQVVFVLRLVDDRLDVHKDIVGLYSTASLTADSLVAIIQDVLLRLNLSIERCRDTAMIEQLS